MLISAELRWFWKGPSPSAIQNWFLNGPMPPGGGKPRNDEYLLDPSQQELGIKRRSGRSGIEVKGLVEVRARIPKPFGGRVQIWTKWTTHALTVEREPRTVIQKTRWLRKFDTGALEVRELQLDADEGLRDGPLPENGCHVELVDLLVGEKRNRWSTFGFEAFGSLDAVERNLQRTIASITPPRQDALAGALELSYPQWLGTIFSSASGRQVDDPNSE
jgi:hypothetical protein